MNSRDQNRLAGLDLFFSVWALRGWYEEYLVVVGKSKSSSLLLLELLPVWTSSKLLQDPSLSFLLLRRHPRRRRLLFLITLHRNSLLSLKHQPPPAASQPVSQPASEFISNNRPTLVAHGPLFARVDNKKEHHRHCLKFKERLTFDEKGYVLGSCLFYVRADDGLIETWIGHAPQYVNAPCACNHCCRDKRAKS